MLFRSARGLLAAAARGWRADAFGDREKKASSTLYSLMQTARANEFEPYACLRCLFAELPAAQSVADFEELLRWTITRDEKRGCGRWTAYNTRQSARVESPHGSALVWGGEPSVQKGES